MNKLDQLFNLYKDKSSEDDVIGPEGARAGAGGPALPALLRSAQAQVPGPTRSLVLPPAGVEKLCKDLKVDPTDRQVLLLAHKVGAAAAGKDPWRRRAGRQEPVPARRRSCPPARALHPPAHSLAPLAFV